MGPLENLGPKGLWDKEAAGWTGAGARLVQGGSFHTLLDVPGEGGDDTRRWEDGSRFLKVVVILEKLAREGIRCCGNQVGNTG